MGPGRFGDGFHGDPGWGDPGWHMLSWGLSSLLWLALLGLLIWAAVRYLQRTQAPAPPLPAPSAFELLRQRYVLGEIDLATFETMVRHVIASEEAERSGWLWEEVWPDHPDLPS